MQDVRVCAACLATDLRMYSMSAASLLEPYRLLTGIAVQREDMPQKLCYECAAMVNKFNMFKLKCERASLLLRNIYMQYDEISEGDVLRVDREHFNLISPYSICSMEVHDSKLINNRKRKKSPEHEISEAEQTNDRQTGEAAMESIVELEKPDNEFFNKEEITIEMESELNDTTDDILEENCSQIKLDSPQKIERNRTRSHVEPKPRSHMEPKQKRVFKITTMLLKEIGMKVELLTKEQQKDVLREKRNTEFYKTARFPCTLCYSHFNEEKTFNDHMLKHDLVSGHLVCDICKLRFHKPRALYNHRLRLHKTRYSCLSCPAVIHNRTAAVNHFKWHKGVMYSCQICLATFDKRSTYQSHLRIKHPSEQACNQCGESFHSAFGLHHHIKLRHKLKRDTVASGGEQETSGPYCAECDIQFTCKQAWTRHILISPKHQHERHICALGCKACGETLPDEDSLQAHRSTHRRTFRKSCRTHNQSKCGGEQETSGPYCAECGIQFKSKPAWMRHILISPKHQNERHICALGCIKCGKTLPDEESLRAHHATHHTTSLKCEQCDEVLETHRAYHTHFRRAHPDKTRTQYPAMRAPFMCEICSRIFQMKAHLKEHSYKHTGERPFKCEVCNKTFTMSSLLRKHMRVHTKEMPYKCNICNRGFSTHSNAYRHAARVHTDATPYACEICDKRFKCRYTAKSHLEYVHMKKPWPKRNRTNRQTNKRQSSND